MKPTLIVALDVPSAAAVENLVTMLPPAVTHYKVGLELFISDGPAALDVLARHDKRVFLDLKLHDIPRQVARAVTAASRHRVALLTVHAAGGRAMLEAAAEAARSAGRNRPKIVAVTTLTCLDEKDLRDIGVTRGVAEQTAAMGRLALDAGIDGLVCSPLEIKDFRHNIGTGPILVTPGVRPAGAPRGDQKRVATPSEAVRDGSNYLVVGRPILQADRPAAAAEAMLREIETSPRDAQQGGKHDDP